MEQGRVSNCELLCNQSFSMVSYCKMNKRLLHFYSHNQFLWRISMKLLLCLNFTECYSEKKIELVPYKQGFLLSLPILKLCLMFLFSRGFHLTNSYFKLLCKSYENKDNMQQAEILTIQNLFSKHLTVRESLSDKLVNLFQKFINLLKIVITQLPHLQKRHTNNISNINDKKKENNINNNNNNNFQQ